MTPWIEALSLYFNASSTTTLEYNPLSFDWINMHSISNINHDLDHFYDCVPSGGGGNNNYAPRHLNEFDAVVSMSSLDHDGLGRYGDPINPNADLESMQKLG